MPHTLEEWQQYETNRQQLPQAPKYAHITQGTLYALPHTARTVSTLFHFSLFDSFAMLTRTCFRSFGSIQQRTRHSLFIFTHRLQFAQDELFSASFPLLFVGQRNLQFDGFR